MNVQITSRQAPLDPGQRTYCEARLREMAKLLSFSTGVDVITSQVRNRHTVEIHVSAKGGGLVIVEESHDLAASLHRAFDGLEKKLKKERAKFREKKRRGGRERKKAKGQAESVVPAEAERRILRANHYILKPLTVEEALLDFDAKKREVLMFRTEDNERWAVLFRRKDGHVGIVEPE